MEIKELREKLGITQKGFAELIYVTLRAVQNWEAPEGSLNHRKPDRRSIKRLNEIINMYESGEL